jgi:hypothetical protein
MVTKENLVYNLNKRLHRKIKQLSPANVRTGAELRNTIPQFASIETLFPTFTKCGNLIPPHSLTVETIFPHFNMVWNPYFPTITRWRNLTTNIY